MTASLYPAPRNVDLSDRAYFRAQRDGALPPGRNYVSELLRGRVDQSTFFQLSTRRQVTCNAIVHNGVLDSDTHLLAKPFTLDQLGAKLRELLGSQRASGGISPG